MCCIGGLEARLATVSLSLLLCLSVDALYLHACQDICTNLTPEKKALCMAEKRIIIKMNNSLIKLTDKTYFHVYPVRRGTTAPNTDRGPAGQLQPPIRVGVRGGSDSPGHGLGSGGKVTLLVTGWVQGYRWR